LNHAKPICAIVEDTGEILEAHVLTIVDYGLLSKGDVIIKIPSDFIGSTLGTSEQQTRSILQSAGGGGSSSGGGGSGTQDPYKAAVIDTIVE